MLPARNLKVFLDVPVHLMASTVQKNASLCAETTQKRTAKKKQKESDREGDATAALSLVHSRGMCHDEHHLRPFNQALIHVSMEDPLGKYCRNSITHTAFFIADSLPFFIILDHFHTVTHKLQSLTMAIYDTCKA